MQGPVIAWLFLHLSGLGYLLILLLPFLGSQIFFIAHRLPGLSGIKIRDWYLILSLISFLGVKAIVVDSGGPERLVISYGIGYWMWVSATFLMMMGLPIEMNIAKKEN